MGERLAARPVVVADHQQSGDRCHVDNPHPFLRHHLGGPDRPDLGTSDTWNACTGSSDGRQEGAAWTVAG